MSRKASERQPEAPIRADPGEITQLLRLWRSGDGAAEARLFEALLPDLRKIARRYFGRERAGHTLQPTALVNEAFLRLAHTKDLEWQDRGHFFGVAARIMRRYLVDYARARRGERALPMEGLPDRLFGSREGAELAIEVDAVLDELAKESPRQRTVVEMKFYLGLTDEEAAEALGLTLHTFQREWHRARRWLFDKLSSKPCKTPGNAANA